MSSIEAYRKFTEKFNFKGRVIYPCSGFDSQPAEVFLDVLFIDQNKEAIEELKKKGHNVLESDIRKLKMDCDLLIAINPSVDSEELLKRFDARFILCNNLHGTADELRKREDFTERELGVADHYLFEKTD